MHYNVKDYYCGHKDTNPALTSRKSRCVVQCLLLESESAKARAQLALKGNVR